MPCCKAASPTLQETVRAEKYNPDTLYAPIGAYTNAIEVGQNETLVVSAGIMGRHWKAS